jgi:hypothetical protein
MVVDTDLVIIMSTIDETKDHMSEGKYIKTCDAVKRIYEKLKKPSIPLPSVTRIQIPAKWVYICSAFPIICSIIKSVTKK